MQCVVSASDVEPGISTLSNPELPPPWLKDIGDPQYQLKGVISCTLLYPWVVGPPVEKPCGTRSSLEGLFGTGVRKRFEDFAVVGRCRVSLSGEL